MKVKIGLVGMLMVGHALNVSGLAAPVDGSNSANVYQLMYLQVKCNNLSPGDEVGIFPVSNLAVTVTPISVVQMLRILRENPSFDFQYLEKKFKAYSLSKLKERTDDLAKKIIDALEIGNQLIKVGNHFKEKFSQEVFDFMKSRSMLESKTGALIEFTQPVPTDLDFDKYYPDYKKSLSMNYEDMFKSQMGYSTTLFNALQQYHSVKSQAKRSPSPAKQHASTKMLETAISDGVSITGLNKETGKYFETSKTAYLESSEGKRVDYKNVIKHGSSYAPVTDPSLTYFANLPNPDYKGPMPGSTKEYQLYGLKVEAAVEEPVVSAVALPTVSVDTSVVAALELAALAVS